MDAHINKIFPQLVSCIKRKKENLFKFEITDEMIALTNYYSSNWHKKLDLNYKGIPLGHLVEYSVKGGANLYSIVQYLLAYEEHLQNNPDLQIGFFEALTIRGQAANIMLRNNNDFLFHPFFTYLQKKLCFSIMNKARHGKNTEIVLDKAASNVLLLEKQHIPYVFLVSLRSYLNPMIPIINNLVQNEKVCLLLPEESKEWSELLEISKKTKIIFLEDLLDKELYQFLTKEKDKFKSKFYEDEDALKDFFQYKGCSFWALLRPAFLNIYKNYFPYCKVWIEIAENVIQQYRPEKFVFSRIRRSIENAFLAVATSNNIDTIQLQHGHFNPESKAWFYGPGSLDSTNKICVFGNWHKNRIMNVYNNSIEKKIVVTGNPRWDKTYDYKTIDKLAIRNKLYRQINLPIQNKWIMFATQYATFGDIIKTLQNPLVNLKESNIIIKIHPGEKKKDYHKILTQKNRDRIRIIKNEYEQFDILKAVDVVIVHSSTVFIESLLVQTPVIFSMVNKIPIENFDPTFYGLPVVKNQEELLSLLHKVLFDERYRETYIGKCNQIASDLTKNSDGKAINRVLCAIMN